MGLSSDVLVVREAVVGAVETALLGATVSTEEPEIGFGLEQSIAFIRLKTIDFEFDNSTYDRASLEFVISARFQHGNGVVSEDRIVLAESIRDQLLQLENPGEIGFGGVVLSIDLGDKGAINDDEFDLRVRYRCWISAGR